MINRCFRERKANRLKKEQEELSWKDKTLYVPQTDDNMDKSYRWLEWAGLKDKAEALIMAAQKQTLGTGGIEARIYCRYPWQIKVRS